MPCRNQPAKPIFAYAIYSPSASSLIAFGHVIARHEREAIRLAREANPDLPRNWPAIVAPSIPNSFH